MQLSGKKNQTLYYFCLLALLNESTTPPSFPFSLMPEKERKKSGIWVYRCTYVIMCVAFYNHVHKSQTKFHINMSRNKNN